MKTKAIIVSHMGIDRFLVVPEDMEPHQAFTALRTLSERVVAQTLDEVRAARISQLINRDGGV